MGDPVAFFADICGAFRTSKSVLGSGLNVDDNRTLRVRAPSQMWVLLYFQVSQECLILLEQGYTDIFSD